MFYSLIFVPDYSHLFERCPKCMQLDARLRELNDNGSEHELNILKMKASTQARYVLSNHVIELIEKKSHEDDIKKLKKTINVLDGYFWTYCKHAFLIE